ncbi:hypothetical protein LJR231_001113 [Phyllobacterium sp. LjRoot231]|uniref:hypothetical protein n=1 Tax=Phyllobacterium sp. LjRoot231 TaxID=3342289 RepID=UPI003ED144B1
MDEDGYQWLVNPHELRRFFTTAWVWYYELGEGLDALRQYLRHADINTTLLYGMKVKAGDNLSVEQRTLTLSILEKAAFDGLERSGAAAKPFLRLLSKIRVSVVPKEQIFSRIEKLVDLRELRLFPLPWGYCAWWRKSAASAKCITSESRRASSQRPDERKHAVVCGDGCINFLLTENPLFFAFWRHARERHQRILDNPRAPEILREAAARGKDIADRFYNEANNA